MYLRRVLAPTMSDSIPIMVFSVFPLAFFTMVAAKGEARVTPRDMATIMGVFTWLLRAVYVAKPTRLTRVSERACMETEVFSSSPDIMAPVVIMGPNPLPEMPLLKEPRMLMTVILGHEKLDIRDLLVSMRAPEAMTRAPMYRPTVLSGRLREVLTPMMAPTMPRPPVTRAILRSRPPGVKSAFLRRWLKKLLVAPPMNEEKRTVGTVSAVVYPRSSITGVTVKP